MKFRLRLGWLWGSTVALVCGYPPAAQAASGLPGVPSCAAVAQFLNRTAASRSLNGALEWGENNLECGGVGGAVGESPLELLKTRWNEALRRWEFVLRCARPEQCVPFLAWSRTSAVVSAEHSATESWSTAQLGFPAKSYTRRAKASRLLEAGGGGTLVKPGQTATLTWEQSGLRIVLPVTCLDGGAIGEFIRVRFKNAPLILRAEVVGKAALRARL